MNKQISIFALFYCCLQPMLLRSQTEQDSFQLEHSLAVTVRYATTDNLGNLYLITQQNAIEKYAPDQHLLCRYSNNRLGATTWLDVTNPLKVLIWYADFRTVVFLDRNLTQLGELNLLQKGYPEVRTVAATADGNIWLYDELAFQLKKISPSGETRFESPALNLLLPGRIQISAIRDNGLEVLASDPEQGILWFDIYAQFQRMLPWKNISSFVLGSNYLAYLSANHLHWEQLEAFDSAEMPLPASAKLPEAQVWLARGSLLVQNGEELEKWRW